MKKMQNIFDLTLYKEEKELLDSVERGEWKSVKKTKKTYEDTQPKLEI